MPYHFFSAQGEVPTYLDETSKELIMKLRVVIPEAGGTHYLPSLQALLTHPPDKHMSRYSKVESYNGRLWFSGQMFVSDWKQGPSIRNRHT
jgi:hypothetical protein